MCSGCKWALCGSRAQTDKGCFLPERGLESVLEDALVLSENAFRYWSHNSHTGSTGSQGGRAVLLLMMILLVEK